MLREATEEVSISGDWCKPTAQPSQVEGDGDVQTPAEGDPFLSTAYVLLILLLMLSNMLLAPLLT